MLKGWLDLQFFWREISQFTEALFIFTLTTKQHVLNGYFFFHFMYHNHGHSSNLRPASGWTFAKCKRSWISRNFNWYWEFSFLIFCDYLFIIYFFFSCINHWLIKEHGLEDFIATVISSSRNCPVWLLAPDSPHSVSNTR